MKKTKLIAALAGLAAASNVMAFSYDGGDDAPVGTAAIERHAVAFTTELTDCSNSFDLNGDTTVDAADNACLIAQSNDSEFTAAFEVANATTCSNGLGAACIPANVADTYTDGTALTNLGAAWLHAPNNTNPLGGRDIPLTTTFSDDSNYGTDANGKIVSGFVVADSDFTTLSTIGVFFFPEHRIRTYRGDTTSPLWNAACGTDLGVSFESCIAIDADPLTPDIIPASEQDFDYMTMPAGSGGSKSVPVPAFAAAALGLGLIGVTIASSRRRKLK